VNNKGETLGSLVARSQTGSANKFFLKLLRELHKHGIDSKVIINLLHPFAKHCRYVQDVRALFELISELHTDKVSPDALIDLLLSFTENFYRYAKIRQNFLELVRKLCTADAEFNKRIALLRRFSVGVAKYPGNEICQNFLKLISQQHFVGLLPPNVAIELLENFSRDVVRFKNSITCRKFLSLVKKLCTSAATTKKAIDLLIPFSLGLFGHQQEETYLDYLKLLNKLLPEGIDGKAIATKIVKLLRYSGGAFILGVASWRYNDASPGRALLKLFRKLLRTGIAPAVIIDLLSQQSENGDTFGMELTKVKDDVLCEEYEKFLTELLSASSINTKAAVADKAAVAEKIFNLLTIRNLQGQNYSIKLAVNKSYYSIKKLGNGSACRLHFKLLGSLIDAGIEPKRMVDLLVNMGCMMGLDSFSGWIARLQNGVTCEAYLDFLIKLKNELGKECSYLEKLLNLKYSDVLDLLVLDPTFSFPCLVARHQNTEVFYKLLMAGLIPEEQYGTVAYHKRKDFYLYIDQFQGKHKKEILENLKDPNHPLAKFFGAKSSFFDNRNSSTSTHGKLLRSLSEITTSKLDGWKEQEEKDAKLLLKNFNQNLPADGEPTSDASSRASSLHSTSSSQLPDLLTRRKSFSDTHIFDSTNPPKGVPQKQLQTPNPASPFLGPGQEPTSSTTNNNEQQPSCQTYSSMFTINSSHSLTQMKLQEESQFQKFELTTKQIDTWVDGLQEEQQQRDQEKQEQEQRRQKAAEKLLKLAQEKEKQQQKEQEKSKVLSGPGTSQEVNVDTQSQKETEKPEPTREMLLSC